MPLAPFRRVACLVVVVACAGAAASGQSQPPSQAAPINAGLVLVAKIEGSAWSEVDGARAALRVDAKVPEHAVVSTGANSSLVLVFSNATTLTLAGETQLRLAHYFQAPFPGSVNMGQAVKEPSTSQTRLELESGAVTARVPVLRVDEGSSFRIITPVGEIAPRADTSSVFLIEFRRPVSGTAHFVAAAEVGSVEFGSPGAAQRIVLPTGQEIRLNVQVEAGASGSPRIIVTPDRIRPSSGKH